jgi:hypothetical protein
MRIRQSLLRTPKLYEDESLAGYILRLTENNFYEKVSEIYLLSDLWLTIIRNSIKKHSNLGKSH